MSLTITRSTDRIEVRTTTLMIYGAPGLRKSSLAYTAEAPLLLDFDKGAHRAFGRKDTVLIESWADVANMTADDLAPFKTIVIDTAGRCLDAMSADIIKRDPRKQNGGALTQQGFGVLKSMYASWMAFLSSLGKDIVLIAHDKEEKKGDEFIFRADIQGSSHGEVFKRADGVAYLYTSGRDTVLDFSPTDRWRGKNPARFEPITLPTDFSAHRDFLAKIIADVKESLNRMSDEQRELLEKLNEWHARAAEVSDADQLNALVADARQLVPPLSPQVTHIIRARAKELGAEWQGKGNKGAYVIPAPAEAVAE